MQIPQIRLQQTYAQIGLRTTQPVQEIQQIPADLSIKQTPAEMNIERTPSHLDIDQDQARYEVNMKIPSVFSSDNADFAKQQGLQAIAEIAQEGDQLASIKTKNNAILSIAKQKAIPGPSDFNIAFIPSYGSVKLNFTPAEIQIDWQQGGAEIDSTQHQPILNYTPGKTEVYLRQMQQLQIDFVGVNVDNKS